MKRIDEEPTQEQIRDSLENDRIGRRGTVERFIHLLSIIEGPYSLFIDSPWGTGKTFFVKQVAKVLKSANPNINIEDRMEMPVLDDDVRQRLNDSPIRPVYFNAWENDHFDDPIAPLLATIASEADDADTKSGKSVHDIIASAIECAFSACGTNVGRLIDSISGEDFLDAFKKRDELRLMLSELTSALIPEKANKVVLFIDELDRCRPEFATRLLEQTKSLFRQDGVIVVYSTDMTKLAYSLQGLYGPNYGCQKYLQRFYDFRFELPRISPIKYLDAKCANIHTSYCFTDIALRYIELHDSSLRTCNRFFDKLNQGARYIDNNPSSQEDIPIAFSKNALLPTLLAMAEFAPSQWAKVKTGSDFKCVFEFAKENGEFIEYLNRTLLRNQNRASNTEATEEEQMDYVENVCAMIFLDDISDPRLKRAERSIRTWGAFDRETLRTLSFPS